MSRTGIAVLLTRYRVAIQVCGVLAVPVLSISAFISGVATTGVPDMPTASVTTWVYSSFGLFVFGGLDLGFPTGGPTLGRVALWAAFFLAPAITTSAVIDAVLQGLRPDWLTRRTLQNHVVIVGAGQVGITYLQAIHVVQQGQRVLLVDGGGLPTGDDIGLTNVTVLRADLNASRLLDDVGLHRASMLILTGDDDLVNLQTAWAAKRRHPQLPVAVQVANLALLRPVSRLIHTQAKKNPDASQPLVFNAHRIGALQLYERVLQEHFDETGYKDVLVIAGFGRFGQTILELMRVLAADELQRVVIVEPNAAANLRKFAADVPVSDLDLATVDGDLEDPGTWTQVEEVLSDIDSPPVFLILSNKELVNLQVAMLLRRRAKEPRIFARCVRRTDFAVSLADQLEFELVFMEDVLREALEDYYRGLSTL
ncbi:MAG: Trk K+ transport system NAD-binding subunit [Kiritimatiellia bacterium]|jgi:Trk K+ transport system NAD-binding subunit